VTSLLLSSLVLAPAIATWFQDRSSILAAFVTSGGLTEQDPLSPLWLLIPGAAALVALAVGVAMMLMRAPRPNKNRCLPVWSLLAVYISAIASLAYAAYGLSDFAQSGGAFATINEISSLVLVLLPVTALILYAVLRAFQLRKGEQRRSALAFAATIRYGSALAVGFFAIVYVGLVACTAHLGVRADAYARNSFHSEAAVVQKAFK
jgi:bacteriorhodopsin